MAESLVTDRPLPVQPSGTRASGWSGLLFVIGTEAALFAYLLFSYFFLASQAPGSGRRMASHPCGSRDRIP